MRTTILGVLAVAVCAAVVSVAGAATIRSGVDGTVTLRLVTGLVPTDIERNAVITSIPLAWGDRLVARGAKLEIVPYLATSWTVAPATRPKSITFKLRRDATCSDGTPVTPLVVLNSFKRYIQVPKLGLNGLVSSFGPGPYHLAANMKKWTFTFRSETPYRNLLAGFSDASSVIYCPQALAASLDDLTSHVYGSGPYKLVTYNPNDQWVFELRPEWKWGPRGTTSKDLPSTLIFRVVSDDTTAANLLLTGGLTATANAVAGPDVDRLEGDRALIKRTAQSYHVRPLVFNMAPGRITTDESVRAALSAAVDVRKWVIAADAGRSVAPGGMLLPGQECYTKEYRQRIDKVRSKYSVDDAKAALRQGGWVESGGRWTKNGQRLRVTVVTSIQHGSGGDYLQDAFSQVGIEVDEQNLAPTLYGQRIIGGNFDVGVVNRTTVAPDLGLNLPIVSGPPPPKGQNLGYSGVGDEDYARLALHVLQKTGPEGCQLYYRLMERALSKHYFLPLAAPTAVMVGRGWDFVPSNGIFEVYSLRQVR